MRRALELAARGLGRTSPNPAVGAVVVRDGAIIAEAFHPRPGEYHAERLALLAAGEQARGADLYCTLEPCCHHGRTPPCTDIIIGGGVRRVWYGSDDPDPRCAGQGEAALRGAGIEVHRGLLREATDEHYAPYFKHQRTGLPWVTLKLACSLDGMVATGSGQSRWITGPEARALVHEWRDQADAVMVGIGTVLADDPELTVRPAPSDGRQPLRVVVDSTARTPPTARVLAQEAGMCLVAASVNAPEDRTRALVEHGAEVVPLPQRDGRVDLPALLANLGERGIVSVLCEGGPGLAAGLASTGLVDQYRLFYAPKLIGGDGRAALGPLGVRDMSEAPRLRLGGLASVGGDVLVTAYPCLPD